MIYKKQYGQPFDTESVVGSFLPMMETIPYLTKEPDGFSYAMEPQDVLYGLGESTGSHILFFHDNFNPIFYFHIL